MEARITRYGAVKSIRVSGTSATFKDQSDNEYTVNVDQPIYFESNTSVVFMFGEDGKLHQALRDKVKKVNLNTVHSPAKPNPDLSIL